MESIAPLGRWNTPGLATGSLLELTATRQR